MTISSGFKEFNSTKSLTVHSRRPKFRQDQAQGILEDCQSSLESLCQKESLKYFETRPSQPRSFENFRRYSVDCLKITENK